VEWIKFDRSNPPESRKSYLITDGLKIDISFFPSDDWGLFDQYGIRKVADVTHYVKIELPSK
jgi:hypothetical protein